MMSFVSFLLGGTLIDCIGACPCEGQTSKERFIAGACNYEWGTLQRDRIR